MPGHVDELRRALGSSRFATFAGSSIRIALIVLASFSCAPTPPPATSTEARQTSPGPADAFLVVDCLLPGQIRRLGNQITFVGPRRAEKTTARDCEIRGGEYVAYDRADYRKALKVWMEAALVQQLIERLRRHPRLDRDQERGLVEVQNISHAR